MNFFYGPYNPGVPKGEKFMTFEARDVSSQMNPRSNVSLSDSYKHSRWIISQVDGNQ